VTERALTIAYSVLAEGLSRVVLPPARSNTEILMLVQGAGGVASKRRDVRVIRLKSTGVAASRNAAIREAIGKVLVFGEEDVTWLPDGLAAVIATFKDNPRLAVLLGRANDETGALRKRYPAIRESATIWNSGRVGTIELAVRPELIRQANVTFDEDFGAGTPNFLGDEYIFVADANRAKLKCDYFPITFSQHPKDSSGTRFGTDADARARSRVFERVFGSFATVVRAGLWLRNPIRFGSFVRGLRFVIGAFPR
jgi:glycosyltransferase involved in cell wall biosynthesis